MEKESIRRPAPLIRFLVAASFILAVGCSGPPRPPERPTFERVAVNQRAVGIPYGPVVLFKIDQQLVALRVSNVPLSGYGIEYEWNTSALDATVFETTSTGAGETKEKIRPGSIHAGPLFMQWSRGSKKYGWLYWPDDSSGISVSSITFRNVASIHLQDPQIFWYKQEMFE